MAEPGTRLSSPALSTIKLTRMFEELETRLFLTLKLIRAFKELGASLPCKEFLQCNELQLVNLTSVPLKN